MSDLAPYPEYKDSGIEWVGRIPSAWTVLPLSATHRRIKESGHPELELLSVYRDHGVIPKTSRDDNHNKASEDLSSYQRVQPGDVILNKLKAWQGSIGVTDCEGIVSPAYFTYRPWDAASDVHNRFLHDLLRSPAYVSFYLSRSKGIRVSQWDLDPDAFKATPLVVPPLSEQRQIAGFLDRECAKLDRLLAKQERLIELLKEKRQALISHAVTRGLDPNAKLKPSGIEWLGDVPEHWEVGHLKHWWTAIDCKHITATFVDEGIPLASINEVRGWTIDLSNAKRTTSEDYERLIEGRRKPRLGDILFTRNATVGEASLAIDSELFAMGQDVCLLRRLTDFNPEFLLHILKSKVISEQLEQLMIGSTFKRINVEEIRGLRVTMPPIEEQRAIVYYLADECSRFDALIAKAQQASDLLKERRTSLIAAAVTGKIDVREHAPSDSSSATDYPIAGQR